MQKVGDIVQNLCPKIFGDRWMILHSLILHWNEIAGERIANITRPISITIVQGNKNLVVAIANNCYILELQMKKNQIIEKIAKHICHITSEIHIRFVYSPSHFIANTS